MLPIKHLVLYLPYLPDLIWLLLMKMCFLYNIIYLNYVNRYYPNLLFVDSFEHYIHCSDTACMIYFNSKMKLLFQIHFMDFAFAPLFVGLFSHPLGKNICLYFTSTKYQRFYQTSAPVAEIVENIFQLASLHELKSLRVKGRFFSGFVV